MSNIIFRLISFFKVDDKYENPKTQFTVVFGEFSRRCFEQSIFRYEQHIWNLEEFECILVNKKTLLEA